MHVLTLRCLLTESGQLIPDVHNVSDINANHLVLQGRTLGVIGMGRFGTAVASCLKDMGVSQVLYNDLETVTMTTDYAHYTSLDTLLKEADIICLCCKTTKTGFKLDKSSLQLMKRDAILVDATNGHVINYVDLYDALRDGHISAAGLAIREQGCDMKFKEPLLALNNCHVFPFQEVNHYWDMRSQYAAEIAADILSSLKL